MVGSIVIDGTLTHCGLVYSMCDMKPAQMNEQYCLIQELVVYKFELGHIISEVLYIHNHNNTTKKKDERSLLYKNIYLSLYCKGSKRLFKVCV